MYPETIEIYVSKWKTALLCLGAAVFVFLGIQMTLHAYETTNGRYDPSIIYAIGVIAVAFFGVAFVIGVIKLFQKRPAYIVNATGLVYDTRNPEIHTVKWNEINGIGVMSVKRTKSILISVTGPDAFLARQSSGWKRNLMRMSINQYNAPISISTNSLQISHKDLLDLLESYHANHLKYAGNRGLTESEVISKEL